MTSSNGRRLFAITSTVLAAGASALAGVPAGAATNPNAPRMVTGAARHVLGTSAQLTATIFPKGNDMSYYFQWGATAAYGNVTPTVHVGNGAGQSKVKVGQSIAGLQPAVTYHYRVVGTYPSSAGTSTVFGRDHTFVAKGNAPRFEVPKSITETVGAPFIFAGVLRGLSAAGKSVVLQASAYPYREPFTTIAAPASTDASGRFAFRVANFTTSTAFRALTSELRPLYSPVVIAHAAVQVVLHVRGSARRGLVRLYGTVTPAVAGSPLLIELSKAIKPTRPTKSEATSRFATVFTSVVKRANRRFSRFSVVVNVVRTGRYRAFVKLRPGGPLVSGFSPTVLLHAGPAAAHKRKK